MTAWQLTQEMNKMSNLPAKPSDVEAIDGLEDFDPATDGTLPILKIDHRDGVLVDKLSGERYEEMETVFLGVVKQRILWPDANDDDADELLCKAYDFQTGYPQEGFPWSESGLDEAPTLSCQDCALKEFGSSPKHNSEAPWCTEQHTYVILIGGQPALFTLQRTSLKNSRTYISSFARDRKPMYTCTTKITLNHVRKSKTQNYVVIELARGQSTDEEDYAVYSDMLRRVRTVLRTPRTGSSDNGEAEAVEEDEETPVREPASKAEKKAETKKAEPAPSSDDDMEETPF